MQRDSALAIVLALLALLALGTAAATLTDTAGPPGSAGVGAGTGGGGGDGGGGQSAGGNETQPSRQPLGPSALAVGLCVPWVANPLVTAVALLLLVVLAAVVYRGTGSLAFGLVSILIALGPLILTRAILTAGCELPPPTESSNGSVGNVSMISQLAGGGGSGAENAVAAPSMALGLVLVIALGVAVILLFSATGDDEATTEKPEPEPAVEPEEPDVAAVGRAAGRAADRIEGEADFGNEVFRAWREMTSHLDVPRPESSTPTEFADAAVDAGMAPDDVRELTDLFEEVRYGDAEVTDERERRAVAALRRIEDAYADEGDA